MSTTRRRGSADREARRAELLDAADATIREVGPEASMRAIAEAAGITKPILYRYFGDKSGLYQALADRYTEPLLTQVREALATPDPVERVPATIDAYLRFIEEHPQLYGFLLHRALGEDAQVHSALSRAIRQMGSEVAAAMRAQRDLHGPAALAAEAFGLAIVGMVYAAGDWWLDDRTLTRAELTAYLTLLLRSGLDDLDAQLP